MDVAVGRVAAQVFDLAVEAGKLDDARELLRVVPRRDVARAALEQAVVVVERGDWGAAQKIVCERGRSSSASPHAGLALLERARFRLDRAALLPDELDRAEQTMVATSDAIDLARVARLRRRVDEVEQRLAELPELEPAVMLKLGELGPTRAAGAPAVGTGPAAARSGAGPSTRASE